MTGLQMKYFVLKPHGNDVYAAASRAAMRSYANMIREENREMSDQLREWADREQILAKACTHPGVLNIRRLSIRRHISQRKQRR